MNLEQQQLRDKNKTAFIGVLALSGFVLILTALGYMNNITVRQTIRLVVSLFVPIINIALYRRLKNDERFEHVACLTLTALYIASIFTASEPTMYAIVYPTAILVMTFTKKRLVQIGSASAMLFLFISHVILVSRGVLTTAQFIIELAFTLISCVLASNITGMLIKHSAQNLNAVKESADAQIETTNKIVALAEDLYNKFENAKSVSENLNERMNSSHESVSEIANSSKTTAEAIEEQTTQTADIQKSIQSVGDEARSMADISDKTSASVLEGVELIEQLKQQAQQVAEINIETKETTEMLNLSIKDVQAITDTILGISSQTNLLALNASIEAARAGEAGKGFAVVADEIRTLSEGTREATEKITAIIGKLTQDANSASESMMKSAEYAQKQHDLITATGQKLSDIKSDTDELRSGLQNVNASVDSIINANTLIMDSITNLSALSEQVAASTESVLHESDRSLEALGDMNNLLAEINSISKQMEETCNK